MVYVLKEKTMAKIILLNAIGEEITVLVNEEQDKGFHKVEFNASTLASGVYFYRLQAGEFVQTREDDTFEVKRETRNERRKKKLI